MADMRKNVTSIINWLHQALDTLIVLVRGSENEKAVELIGDVRDVISSYLGVFQGFIPKNAITPMPGNFWKKLVWIAQNTGWIQALAMLTCGQNPFEAAKVRAAVVAAKWGFTADLEQDALGDGL
jgi:hypothetical protein